MRVELFTSKALVQRLRLGNGHWLYLPPVMKGNTWILIPLLGNVRQSLLRGMPVEKANGTTGSEAAEFSLRHQEMWASRANCLHLLELSNSCKNTVPGKPATIDGVNNSTCHASQPPPGTGAVFGRLPGRPPWAESAALTPHLCASPTWHKDRHRSPGARASSGTPVSDSKHGFKAQDQALI